MILKPLYDPLGQAAINYLQNNDDTPVIVTSDSVDDDELLPSYFFRNLDEMPKLEQIALQKCAGKILDVGAGCGCHSLYLQSKGFDVTAVECSELSCKVMKERGVKNIINADICDLKNQRFDTIILLMNGIGIAGTPDGLKKLLEHFKDLLNPQGKIILDSSDLIYLYEEEDGSVVFDLNADQYYGVISYKMKYKSFKSKKFNWLFADQVLLAEIAEEQGFKTNIVEYGEHYDYLAELTIKQKNN